MTDELDLERLEGIPDPFADAGSSASAGAPALPATASPTRADVRRRRVAAAVAAALYEVAWVALVEHRHDLGSLPAWSLVLGLAVPLGAAALALGAASGSGRLGLGAPARWLALLCVAAPVLFAVVTLVTSPHDEDGPFWSLAGRCMAVTALLTAPPVALAVVAFRRAFVAASAWRTAALGIACGALAAATMSLVCWHAGGLHIVVGHGALMVVAGAVGALLGRSVTRG
jgi:hypothetical protein